eukprot:TRINITY_DN1595_c0_g1_i2.p1 TRINITY_DN1595_c0_g1~~TRINITY_DN1595_c0_g1_i2.p1  ORF type:complete len:203 (-),score=30.36 TRINITY_DN1595_c0_g1_i2:18-626(-)
MTQEASFEALGDLLDPDFLASLGDVDVDKILTQFDALHPLISEPPVESEEPAPPEEPATPEKPASPPVFAWMRNDTPSPKKELEEELIVTGRAQRWTLGKTIAASEKATVREALGEDGRRAAVKVLPRSHRDNELVDQEAAIACAVSTHESVLDFFDYVKTCLLYTSDAADEEDSGDLGGRRIHNKKNKHEQRELESVHYRI